MKIIRLNIIDTITEVDPNQANESISFDLGAERGPRTRYVAVVQGITDTERYILTLQDENGVVVDMSTTFSVPAEQLSTPALSVTIELSSTRIPRGILRCVRVADLVARQPEPLAS